MKTYFLLTCLFLSFTSCYFSRPLSTEQIEQVKSTAVEDFQLEIATEFHFKRIDLIRQTETETDLDGDCETVDVDYHPLGFDLGNGLFFDLNGNLTIRIDSLLDLKKGEDYLITKKNWRLEPDTLLFENEQYCYKRGSSRGKERIFCSGQIEYVDNGLRYYQNNRLRYDLIEKKDTTTLIHNGLLSRDTYIFKESMNHFFTKIGRRKVNYNLTNNVINLQNNKYSIQLNPETQNIEIFTTYFRKKHLTYQIKISENKIVFFGSGTLGKMIIYTENGFTIYKGSSQNPMLQMEKLL